MAARRTLAASLVAAAVFAGALGAAAQEETGRRSVLLVLDASGSMNARMAPEKRTRFEAARTATADMLARLPDSVRVALRVYGHQSATKEGNCEDTELVAPFDAASRNRAPILTRIGGLKPLGYTPISLSLQRAANDLGGETGAERVIVLVSDGRETCRADPCAVAKALAAADARLVVHTVGLGVDAAARTQLQCIAHVARGTYFDAVTSRELSERLQQAAVAKATAEAPRKAAPAATGVLTVKGIAEFGVPIYDAKEELVGSVGTIDPRKELPPGVYSVKFANGAWSGIEIRAGETTVIEPAYLRIETVAKDNLYLVDAETGAELGDFFMASAPLAALLPGRYAAHTSLPFVWSEIELVAGRTTTLRPALVRIVHRSGGENVLYRIVQIETGIEGSAVNGDELAMPPGRYRIEDPDRAGTAQEVEVKENETREVVITR